MVRKINSERRVCVWIIFLYYFEPWAGFCDGFGSGCVNKRVLWACGMSGLGLACVIYFGLIG